MIVEYNTGDIDKFKPNAFSKPPEDMRQVIESDLCNKFTLWNNGKVKAVLCYIETQPKEFLVFVLMAKNFVHTEAREVKRFTLRMMRQFEARRVFTLSEESRVINRWHKFFSGRITEPKYSVIDGKTYNVWEVL